MSKNHTDKSFAYQNKNKMKRFCLLNQKDTKINYDQIRIITRASEKLQVCNSISSEQTQTKYIIIFPIKHPGI